MKHTPVKLDIQAGKDKRLVYGVGINDLDTPVEKKRVKETLDNGKQKFEVIWKCPFYLKWHIMLQRCYDTKMLERNPTYKGCSVCEEWHLFSNFKRWMETQDWEGKQLDKDLLVKGNKIYSPETCLFVSIRVNSFLTDSKKTRGLYPIGVYLSNGKYKAQCRDPFKGKQEHLGVFLTPEEAHMAWLVRKREIAVRLAKEQTDPRVAKALLDKYCTDNYED